MKTIFHPPLWLRSVPSVALLCLALAVTACDKGEAGSGLPDASGDKAPARAAIPTPAKTSPGDLAHQASSHRWVGNVRAKHHVELAPGMTGVIASIEFEEGDSIEKGDKVFRIEGAEVKLMVSQAQAALASAELQLAEAERETERTRKLTERGSVGQANLERSQAGVEAAKAGVKQAKAAVSVARARTADLVVESPISGTVTAKYKNVGEVATMMPPTTVVVIDDLSLVEVRVRVPELKLREVDVGSPLTVYFPALDHEVEVPVTRIGNSVDPQTRTIELIIEVENPNLRIKAGMSVEVEIGQREAEPAEPGQDPAAAGQAEPQPRGKGENKTADVPTAMVTKPG